MEDWASGAAKGMGQSKQQALEAAGTYGNLFQAFGVGLPKATEMSTTLTTLASDLASFNNTSVDEAIEALRSGLSGETEPLKRYGVALSDVRIRDEALAQGLISNVKDAMSPAIKAQAIYALTLQDTALAQGDFGRTSGGLANQQKILGAQFTDLKAKIGNVLLPIVLKFVSFLNNSAIPALSEIGRIAQIAFGAFVGAFQEGDITSKGWVGVIERIGLAVRIVVQFIRDNWHFVPDAIALAWRGLMAVWDNVGAPIFDGIIFAAQAVVNWFRDNWDNIAGAAVTAFDAVVIAGQRLVDWARDIWPTAKQFIVDGFTDIVGSGDELVVWFQTRWLEIQTIAKAVADFFVNTVWPAMQTAWDTILRGAQGVVNWFRTNWGDIGKTFADVVTIIRVMGERILLAVGVLVAFFILLWRQFGDDIIRYTKAAWDAVSQIIAGALTVIRGLIALVAAILTLDWSKAWEAMSTIVDGAWQIINGIIDLAIARVRLAIDMMVQVVISLFTLAWDAAKAIVSAGWDAIVSFCAALPGRIIGALSSLLGVLTDHFRASWESAKTAMAAVVLGIIAFVQAVPGRILAALGNLGGLLFNAGFAVMQGLANGIISGYRAISSAVGNIAETIVSGVGNLGSILVEAGKAAIGGLVRGIVSAVGSTLKNAVTGIASQIVGWKGPLPYDETVLVPNGVALMKGLNVGIMKGLAPVKKTLTGIAPNMSLALSASSTIGPVQPITIVNQGNFLGTEEAFGALADRAIARARRGGYTSKAA